MSEHRRYLTIIQDPRGYPAKGGPEPAPPEGPAQPVLHRVVLEGDYDELRARIDGALKALDRPIGPGESRASHNANVVAGARSILREAGSVSDGD